MDAVGMEAHGSPFQAALLGAAGKLPGPLARKAAETVGVDRMAAMRTAFYSVRRAGTISLIGVYGGQADPFPMLDCSTRGSRSGWDRHTSSAGSRRSFRP